MSFDQPVQPKAAEVVPHLRGAVIPAEESGHLPAMALVGEASDGADGEAERAGQGHGTQGSGSLALSYVGLVDALKAHRADGTALARHARS